MNMQNLPRGSKLRYALVPPPGHKVVVGDLGQIEARLTVWLAAQVFGTEPVLLKAFREGKDPYAMLASTIFNFTVDRNNPDHFVQGFIGKSGVLGLGFGAAAPKFYIMVIRSARAMGLDVEAIKKIFTPELSASTVSKYRNVNRETVSLWKKLDWYLEGPWQGVTGPAKLGPVVIGKGLVTGPGGAAMRYEVLGKRDGEMLYSFAERTHKIYGAKFLENIIQFLARIILMHAALRIADRGYPFALQAHDELGFIVPDAGAEECKRIVHEELTRRPSWAPDLPLKADVKIGTSYGDAK
jgi:DNA polymerase